MTPRLVTGKGRVRQRNLGREGGGCFRQNKQHVEDTRGRGGLAVLCGYVYDSDAGVVVNDQGYILKLLPLA